MLIFQRFRHLENCIRVAIFLLAESSMLYIPLSVTPASVLHWVFWPTYLPQLDWNLAVFRKNPMILTKSYDWKWISPSPVVNESTPQAGSDPRPKGPHLEMGAICLGLLNGSGWCKQIRPAKWPDVFKKQLELGEYTYIYILIYIYIYISWFFEFNRRRVI